MTTPALYHMYACVDIMLTYAVMAILVGWVGKPSRIFYIYIYIKEI